MRAYGDTYIRIRREKKKNKKIKMLQESNYLNIGNQLPDIRESLDIYGCCGTILLADNEEMNVRGNPSFIMLNRQLLDGYRNDPQLPVVLRVFLYLLSKADIANGIAYQTASDIVKALGASRSNVDNALNLLTRKGLISKVKGKGRSKHFRICAHRAGQVKGLSHGKEKEAWKEI